MGLFYKIFALLGTSKYATPYTHGATVPGRPGGPAHLTRGQQSINYTKLNRSKYHFGTKK